MSSGTHGSPLSCDVSRHFEVASAGARRQTGRNSSTTMASPRAPPLLRLHLDRCSAQTDCTGRIDPMSPLWGRSGHQYQAPQEPECGRSRLIEKRFWVVLQYNGGEKRGKKDYIGKFTIHSCSVWVIYEQLATVAKIELIGSKFHQEKIYATDWKLSIGSAEYKLFSCCALLCCAAHMIQWYTVWMFDLWLKTPSHGHRKINWGKLSK